MSLLHKLFFELLNFKLFTQQNIQSNVKSHISITTVYSRSYEVYTKIQLDIELAFFGPLLSSGKLS